MRLSFIFFNCNCNNLDAAQFSGFHAFRGGRLRVVSGSVSPRYATRSSRAPAIYLSCSTSCLSTLFFGNPKLFSTSFSGWVFHAPGNGRRERFGFLEGRRELPPTNRRQALADRHPVRRRCGLFSNPVVRAQDAQGRARVSFSRRRKKSKRWHGGDAG